MLVAISKPTHSWLWLMRCKCLSLSFPLSLSHKQTHKTHKTINTRKQTTTTIRNRLHKQNTVYIHSVVFTNSPWMIISFTKHTQNLTPKWNVTHKKLNRLCRQWFCALATECGTHNVDFRSRNRWHHSVSFIHCCTGGSECQV